jgi:hypothetical protein
MKNPKLIRNGLMILSILFLFSLNGFAQRIDCTQTTDEQLVNTIIDAATAKFGAEEMYHINVTAKNGVITLAGWATDKKIKKEIEKLTKKTKCVKSVVNKLKIGIGGGCAAGEIPCGGICIPETETCNIRPKTKVN